ncbi:unnamed protein product [Diabrotica balteata]|uniref:BED-type domain-containing protein n=1 Tax=Diabrotica balteata TaxID=107213 RepID=A0A9N9T8A3_DIABA|nr:unnamed protein product [Diabrotica balteata]
MNRKNKSVIWNYFKAENKEKRKCNLCSQIISYKSRSINFKKHLQRKHPPFVNIEHDSSSLQSEMTNANKRQLPETENNDGDNTTEGSSSSSIHKQTQLDYAPRTVGRAVPTKIDRCLIKLITTDFHRSSIVEDKYFRISVSVLNPAYQIPNNAANITKAVKDIVHWKHLGCLAHTINLIANDCITIIEPVIAKIRNLVTYFKRSTSAIVKLLYVQKQSGKIPKKLLQDVSTRWNSTYCMLERILDLGEVVLQIFNTYLKCLKKCTNHYDI